MDAGLVAAQSWPDRRRVGGGLELDPRSYSLTIGSFIDSGRQGCTQFPASR
jgi:hypothetical protein